MYITPRKRTKIVTLCEHSSMTQRDIGKMCFVSLGVVHKILKQKRDTGTIEVNRKSGRKRKTIKQASSFFNERKEIKP